MIWFYTIIWLTCRGFWVYFSQGYRCNLYPLTCLSCTFIYRQNALHIVVGGGGILYGGYWGVWGKWLIWRSLARLPEEVNPIAIFPLGPLHTDPVRWNPVSLYAAVGGAHQSDRNPTLDVPTRLRVELLPLGVQVAS